MSGQNMNWREMTMQIITGVVIAGMVALGGGIWRGYDRITSLEVNIGTIKGSVDRHENLIEKEMKRLESVNTVVAQRTEDHERRLARLESTLEALRNDTAEMKKDIKSLLRGLSQP